MSPVDPWGDGESVAAVHTLCADADDEQWTVEGARYEERGTVGQGGMGRVDVVRDRWLERDVARKVVVRGDEGRLAREAAITARLAHPGIVTVHDTGVGTDGCRFYTMALVRGESLGAGQEGHLRHVIAAAKAVAYAHGVGVVHRDLKPDNILIGKHGEVQVVDWGIAADSGSRGRCEGTVGWSDPKQLAGDDVDPRHDVYALGQCLAAVIPDNAPADIRTIVLTAQTGGYADANGFATDLAAWLDGERVSAHEYGAGELIWRTVRAFRGPLMVAGVALLALAGLGVWTVVSTAAERDRAVAAEASAQEHLLTLLSEQAVSRFETGYRVEASVLAAQALALGDAPSARGVLAALEDGTRLIESREPPCDDAVLLDSGDVACAVEGGMTVHTWHGTTHWLPHPGATLAYSRSQGWVTGTLDVVKGTGRIAFRRHGDGPTQTVEHAPGSLSRGPGPLMLSHVTQAAYIDWDGQFVQWQPCPGNPRPMLSPNVRADGRATWACAQMVVVEHESGVPTEYVMDSDPASVAWWGDAVVFTSYDGTLGIIDVDGAIVRVPIAGGTAARLRVTGDVAVVNPERGPVSLFHLPTRTWQHPLPSGAGPEIAAVEDVVVTLGSRWSRWALPEVVPGHVVTAQWSLTSGDWSARDGLLLGGGDIVQVVGPDGVQDWDVPGCLPVKDVSWAGADTAYAICAGNSVGVVRLTPGSVQPVVDSTSGPDLIRLPDGTLMSVSYGTQFALTEPRTRPLQTRRFYADGVAFRGLSVGGGRVWGVNAVGHAVWTDAVAPRTVHTMDWTASRIAAGVDDLLVGDDYSVERRQHDASVMWRYEAEDQITALAWSPDEALVAIGFLGGETHLLRSSDGELLAVLPGHQQRVADLVFSANSELATVSWDGSARLWELDSLDETPAAEVLRARWGL